MRLWATDIYALQALDFLAARLGRVVDSRFCMYHLSGRAA